MASVPATASRTPTPDALSSAPGACGTVSRWAPTSRCGSPGRRPGGVATTLTERPAPTGTPHETPAGTSTGWSSTSRPERDSSRATQRAARSYDGLVASRGPMRPARCRTASTATCGSKSAALTPGVGDGAGARSGAGVAGVAGVVETEAGDRSTGASRLGSPLAVHATAASPAQSRAAADRMAGSVSRGSRAGPASGSGGAAWTSSWTRSAGCARASRRRPCRSRRASSAGRR